MHWEMEVEELYVYTQYDSIGTPWNFRYQCPTYTQTFRSILIQLNYHPERMGSLHHRPRQRRALGQRGRQIRERLPEAARHARRRRVGGDHRQGVHMAKAKFLDCMCLALHA